MISSSGWAPRAVRVVLLLAAMAGLTACASLKSLTSDTASPAPVSSRLASAYSKAQGSADAKAVEAKPAASAAKAAAPKVSPAAAQPTAAAPADAVAAVGTPRYRVGVGDKVRIDVHGEADLTMEFIVSEAGAVNYPFLGELTVSGQTLEQLQQRIDSGLRGSYLVNPDVRVIVVEYRKFYVNGEVRVPGGYPFFPGVTVRQAAALAGGFTERASMGRISVFREGNPNAGLPATLDTPVYPGDTIVIAQGLF